MFMSLEGEPATSNIFGTALKSSFLPEAISYQGTVEIASEEVAVPVIDVIAGHVEGVTIRLQNLALMSRDFH
ncbi:MAG TPA: hypothetical protein VIM59_15050 [Cellvibrio sp.]